jgi:hypothetical protein
MAVVVPIEKQKKTPGKKPWRAVQYDDVEVKKLEKKLGEPALEELKGLALHELKDYLGLLGNYEEETKQAEKKDPDIETLKAKIADARSSYRETLNGIKARRAYVCHLIAQKL